MKILTIGSNMQQDEVRQKFGAKHAYQLAADHHAAQILFEKSNVVFDFTIEQHPAQILVYRNFPALPVFLDISSSSLSKLGVTNLPGIFFGFCGLTTFLNREILEVSVSSADQSIELTEICKGLQSRFEVVEDRVGLVTPRVICMIINEAYRTVEEGTATREDIDLAMKLGTNYPYGPFEWCKKIGVKSVCQLLDAAFADTKDERYTVCKLLEKEKGNL